MAFAKKFNATRVGNQIIFLREVKLVNEWFLTLRRKPKGFFDKKMHAIVTVTIHQYPSKNATKIHYFASVW